MSWTNSIKPELKKFVNSTIGTAGEKPLDRLIVDEVVGQVVSQVEAIIKANEPQTGTMEYKTAGNYTWEKPAGVKVVTVQMIGGGGRGGDGSGGGGGAGYVIDTTYDVSSVDSFSVVVGAPGASSKFGTLEAMPGGNADRTRGGLGSSNGSDGIRGSGTTLAVGTDNAFNRMKGGIPANPTKSSSGNWAGGNGGIGWFGVAGQGRTNAGSAASGNGGGGGGGGEYNDNGDNDDGYDDSRTYKGGLGAPGAVLITW